MDGYQTSTLGLLSSAELEPKAQLLQKHLCAIVFLHFASENNKCLCSPGVCRHFRSLKARVHNMRYTPTRQMGYKQFKDTYCTRSATLWMRFKNPTLFKKNLWNRSDRTSSLTSSKPPHRLTLLAPSPQSTWLTTLTGNTGRLQAIYAHRLKQTKQRVPIALPEEEYKYPLRTTSQKQPGVQLWRYTTRPESRSYSSLLALKEMQGSWRSYFTT